MQHEHKQQFYTDGYVVMRNAVSKDLVTKARRLINCDIGKGFSEQQAKENRSRSWCTGLQGNAHITNLFNASDAYTLACELIGKRLKHQHGAQIALRFPGDSCTKMGFQPVTWWNTGWHIDGFHSPDNGVPKGEIRNFTMLVGIILSDVSEEFCGSLTVYPKSHHVTEKYFNEVGIDTVKENGLSSFKTLPLCKPVQVTGKAGDVVFAHYNLAHTVAPNCSADFRYAIYFRINVRERPGCQEPLMNIWLDFPGLSDIVQQEAKNKEQLIREATSGALIETIYSDERNKIDRTNLKEYQAKIDTLKKQANELYDSKQFAKALPLLEQFIKESPDDYWMLMKAVGSCTWGDPQDASKGEQYAIMAIELSPTTPNGYNMMAQNLKKQKKWDQVVPWVKKLLALTPQEEAPQYVIDALVAAREALLQLDQTDQMQLLVDMALEKYPALEQKIKVVMDELQVQMIWKEAREWTKQPNKNMEQGRKLYAAIVEKKPTDYWATLQLGGCYMWDKKPKEGEPYIRKAIELNSNIPSGHAYLAKDLLNQGRGPEVADVVVNMIKNHTFPSANENVDHGNKVIESLETLRNVTGKDGIFIELVELSKTKWPSLAERLSKL